MARRLWQTVSVVKCILRGTSLHASVRHVCSSYSGTGSIRCRVRSRGGKAVGGLEGGGFSGTMVIGAPWWPDQ